MRRMKVISAFGLALLFAGGAYAATVVTELHPYSRSYTDRVTVASKGRTNVYTVTGTVAGTITDLDTYPDPVTVTQTVTETATTAPPPATTAPPPTTTEPPTTTAPPPPPPPAASAYLSPTGSDASPCTQVAPCRTFQRGYNIAPPGTSVEVACGAYGGQPIQRNGKAQTAPVAFVATTPRCAQIGGIPLGVDNGSESGNSPSVTLEGLDINGSVQCTWGAGAPLKNITVKDSWVHDTSFAGDLFSCSNFDGVSLIDSEFGPACCQGTGPVIGLTNFGTPPNRNFLVSGVRVHDIYDTCRGFPAELGTCSGTGYGDGLETRHMDGIQIIDGHGVTIRDTTVEKVGNPADPRMSGQGIFFAVNNGGSFSDILVERVTVGDTPQTEFSISGPGVGIVSGFVTIRDTRVAGEALIYDRTPVPGTPITISGVTATKVGGYKGESAVYCTVLDSAGAVLPIQWSNTTGDPGCDPTLTTFALSFLEPSWLPR